MRLSSSTRWSNTLRRYPVQFVLLTVCPPLCAGLQEELWQWFGHFGVSTPIARLSHVCTVGWSRFSSSLRPARQRFCPEDKVEVTHRRWARPMYRFRDTFRRNVRTHHSPILAWRCASCVVLVESLGCRWLATFHWRHEARHRWSHFPVGSREIGALVIRTVFMDPLGHHKAMQIRLVQLGWQHYAMEKLVNNSTSQSSWDVTSGTSEPKVVSRGASKPVGSMSLLRNHRIGNCSFDVLSTFAPGLVRICLRDSNIFGA